LTRLLALSGVAFGVLMAVGFFIGGGDTPDYAAADREWIEWADENDLKSAVGAFLTLLGGFAFLHFAAAIRGALEPAELARVAFAGAVTGITGITIALVMIAGATAEGADADPVVSRAVATATVGPFLVAAMGFSVLLAAAGLATLRSGRFSRWIGRVALLGALAFFISFFTLLDGPTEDSVFGYGFLPGFLALAIWSIATGLELRRQSTANGAKMA
jgi:hypothetical protein